MAQKYATVEVWLIVDQDGDTAQGNSLDAAKEDYAENIGALDDQDGFRAVKVLVRVPLPEVSVVEVTAEAPALGAATATV
jgi:hypothetical protein